MREVIITSILERKKYFLGGCFWFKFNNLKLALDMALKFNTKLADRLKLKVRMFWELIPIYFGVIRQLGDIYIFNITNLICDTCEYVSLDKKNLNRRNISTLVLILINPLSTTVALI